MITSGLVCLKLVCLHFAVHFGQEEPKATFPLFFFTQRVDATNMDKFVLITSYSSKVFIVSVRPVSSNSFVSSHTWLNIQCKNQKCLSPVEF